MRVHGDGTGMAITDGVDGERGREMDRVRDQQTLNPKNSKDHVEEGQCGMKSFNLVQSLCATIPMFLFPSRGGIGVHTGPGPPLFLSLRRTSSTRCPPFAWKEGERIDRSGHALLSPPIPEACSRYMYVASSTDASLKESLMTIPGTLSTPGCPAAKTPARKMKFLTPMMPPRNDETPPS
jgi:hypothetical protein